MDKLWCRGFAAGFLVAVLVLTGMRCAGAQEVGVLTVNSVVLRNTCWIGQSAILTLPQASVRACWRPESGEILVPLLSFQQLYPACRAWGDILDYRTQLRAAQLRVQCAQAVNAIMPTTGWVRIVAL